VYVGFFFFKDNEPACANRAAYLDPPPEVPDPESIDAQAAYRGRHSTNARLSPARIVSRHWGVSSPGLPHRETYGGSRKDIPEFAPGRRGDQWRAGEARWDPRLARTPSVATREAAPPALSAGSVAHCFCLSLWCLEQTIPYCYCLAAMFIPTVFAAAGNRKRTGRCTFEAVPL
jgi:hypothetical protein